MAIEGFPYIGWTDISDNRLDMKERLFQWYSKENLIDIHTHVLFIIKTLETVSVYKE